jgi:Gpi18-like mannosyltransferase
VGLRSRSTLPVARFYDQVDEMEVFGRLGTIAHGWDSGWYLRIAGEGYTKMELTDTVSTPYVFFPAYPLAIRMIGTITGNVTAGILVSNICFLLAGIVLYMLIAYKKSKSLAFLTVVYLFVFPVNYIFSAVQSESLFLLLLLAVFYFLEKKKFLHAGVAGLFLALTKYVGFIVFIPIAIYCFKNIWKEGISGKLKTVFYSTLPLIGILIFAFYLYRLTGSPLAILEAEKGWQKAFDINILRPFLILLTEQKNFLVQINFLGGLLIAFFAFFGALRLGLSYVLIVVVYFLVYLTTTSQYWHTFSLPRYFMVLFPAYVYLAGLIKLGGIFKYSAPVALMSLQMFVFSYWTRGWPIPM